MRVNYWPFTTALKLAFTKCRRSLLCDCKDPASRSAHMKAKVIECRLGGPRFAKHNGQEVTLDTWTGFPARASLPCTFLRLLQSIARCFMVDTSNKLLKIRDEPAPKGCTGSIIAFEFEMYISSKMFHHVDINAVNYTSLRHCYKLCMAVLS